MNLTSSTCFYRTFKVQASLMMIGIYDHHIFMAQATGVENSAQVSSLGLGVDQVRLTFQSRHPEADIVWVVEEFLVVGADIDDARKNSAGVETSGRNVEVELADGDAEAADTEITEAKNSAKKASKLENILARNKKVLVLSEPIFPMSNICEQAQSQSQF